MAKVDNDKTYQNNWNLKQWGDDVHQFCQKLGIKKPIVGGISFGGVVAQSYLAQYGNEPAGIILCDSDALADKALIMKGFYDRAKEAYLKEAKANATITQNIIDTIKTKAQRVKDIDTRVFEDPSDEEALAEHFANGIPLCGKNKYDTDQPMACDSNMAVAKIYFQHELFNYDFRPQLAQTTYHILHLHGDRNAVHSWQSTYTAFKNA